MFSVVIPLYNKELSIRDTINSVLKQNFQDFEIIIINDGSTDNSVHEILKINNPKVKVFHKENGGVSSARNLGVLKASNDWIAFLDGDDLWYENHLETIHKMINEFPNSKLFATSFVNSNNVEYKYKINNCQRFSEIKDYFKESLNKHLIWTSVFVSHKSCLEENFFKENLSIGEDLELFGRLVKKNNLVKASDITAVYRLDAENRSNVGRYRMNVSFLSHLNFQKMYFPYEKKYYRKLIIQKIKFFIVNRDWQTVYFLLKKYNVNLII